MARKQEVQAISLPGLGPLQMGGIYRRQDLHGRFGGRLFSGIVTSSREPVILIFHTEEPTQQFYDDGLDENGIYWYSAEGSFGDMGWTAANLAVRDHASQGRDILLFERAQRKGGLWRFASNLQYFDHKLEQRPDKKGDLREAIIFGLLSVQQPPGTISSDFDGKSLIALRFLADTVTSDSKLAVKKAVRNVYVRSEAVRRYALARASGVCEACGTAAPFRSDDGVPFLEVHHIWRLSDDGPDKVTHVAAICPNCHRRCHYSSDKMQYNSVLEAKVRLIEKNNAPLNG